MTEKPVVRPRTSEPWLSEYLHSKGNRLGLPISGTFELTARCNFNCRMCYVHQQDLPEQEKRELSAEQWLAIAREARDAGMMFLLLTGGEPLLRQDFPYLYTELVKMGLVVSINTNASLYNEELRELFNRYPPSRLNVTLYGGSEETYRTLCGNASFRKVVDNLRSMKADGLQVRLNVTLTPYNVGDMALIDEISREIGLQAKASSYLYPPVRRGGKVGRNDARFSPEEAGAVMARWNALRDTKERTLQRAEMIRQRRFAGLTETCADVEQEGVRCRAGRSSFWLTWDGRMLPCGTMDTEASYPLRDGFAKAWQEVVASTAAIRLPKECSGCADRENCSVCASICKGETGAFDCKPEYICTMMKSARDTTVKIAGNMTEERET
ncbi:MAG: radical SAM protein [Clostridia bacterium]|nr:radical SAM protein [Clostridia bacterium]